MKTYSAKPLEVERKWYLIDAEGERCMKIRIVILIIFSLLHVNIGAMGEVLDIDSVSHSKPPHYLIPAIGGSLVVAGSLLDFDHGGSWEGMPYTPSFSYKADEVLRFAPAVALVGMKGFLI